VASPGFAYKKIEGSSDFKEGSVIGKVGWAVNSIAMSF
jgi:hypothetical protein